MIINNKSLININKKVNITEIQIDILRELGNIGSGNAITALSKLLNKNIKMSLTSLNLIPFWKVPYLFNNPKSEFFGILSKIEKQNKFIILQIYPKDSIIKIINNLNEIKQIESDKVKLIEDLDNFSLSIVLEMGNILAGHYTSALADLLSIRLIPAVPNLALDTLGAMTNCIIASCSQNSDFTFILETKLIIEELELTGLLCFISSIDTINKFLMEINKKYNI